MHYDRIKHHIERLNYQARQYKTKNIAKTSGKAPQPPLTSDNNDLLYLEVDSDPSPPSAAANQCNVANQTNITNVIQPSTSSSTNDCNIRPERKAAKAAKRPGFYYIP